MRTRLLALPLFGLAIALGGCHMFHRNDPNAITGSVIDVQAFQAFVSTHPTPDQFRKKYPNVVLILPGMIATREYRPDNSRYFAKLDESGHIIGGQFM
jgi:hypothetical protein